MSVTGLLPHTAEIRRRSSAVDRLGQPVNENPGSMADRDADFTYPCRVTRGKGGRAEGERMVDVFEVSYELFLEAEADIQENDSVRVLGTAGETLVSDAKVVVVNRVYNRTEVHHLEVMLYSQRGPS